jgi:hypothetical protein
MNTYVYLWQHVAEFSQLETFQLEVVEKSNHLFCNQQLPPPPPKIIHFVR